MLRKSYCVLLCLFLSAAGLTQELKAVGEDGNQLFFRTFDFRTSSKGILSEYAGAFKTLISAQLKNRVWFRALQLNLSDFEHSSFLALEHNWDAEKSEQDKLRSCRVYQCSREGQIPRLMIGEKMPAVQSGCKMTPSGRGEGEDRNLNVHTLPRKKGWPYYSLYCPYSLERDEHYKLTFFYEEKQIENHFFNAFDFDEIQKDDDLNLFSAHLHHLQIKKLLGIDSVKAMFIQLFLKQGSVDYFGQQRIKVRRRRAKVIHSIPGPGLFFFMPQKDSDFELHDGTGKVLNLASNLYEFLPGRTYPAEVHLKNKGRRRYKTDATIGFVSADQIMRDYNSLLHPIKFAVSDRFDRRMRNSEYREYIIQSLLEHVDYGANHSRRFLRTIFDEMRFDLRFVDFVLTGMIEDDDGLPRKGRLSRIEQRLGQWGAWYEFDYGTPVWVPRDGSLENFDFWKHFFHWDKGR